MARGGFRPGAGRPRKIKVPTEPKPRGRPRKKPLPLPEAMSATTSEAAFTQQALPTNPFPSMAQALAAPNQPPPVKALEPNPVERPESVADAPALSPGDENPLAYMLRVMNDPKTDDNRRDKLAIAAAPFMHRRAGEVGKKAEKDKAAREAGGGRFGATAPPRLVSNNG